MFRPYIKRTRILVAISVFNLILVYIAYISYDFTPEKDYNLKIRAMEIMKETLKSTYDYSKELDLQEDISIDVFKSGLIGVDSTDSKMTTKYGNKRSKIATTNPEFAALYIDYFSKIDDSLGTRLTNPDIPDTIAVGLTGSFPGANIALLSACKACNIHPVIISSIGSSSWGANRLDMTWIDIEKRLFDEKIFNYKSVAVSLGGDNDNLTELSDSTIAILKGKIEDLNYPLINKDKLKLAVQERIKIYNPLNTDYKAYVNIGGSAVSFGTGIYNDIFLEGLFLSDDEIYASDQLDINEAKIENLKSVIAQFLLMEIPIINIKNIDKLCLKYDLPGNTDRDFRMIDDYIIGLSGLFGEREDFHMLTTWICLIISLLLLAWLVSSSIRQVNKKMEEIENDSVF